MGAKEGKQPAKLATEEKVDPSYAIGGFTQDTELTSARVERNISRKEVPEGRHLDINPMGCQHSGGCKAQGEDQEPTVPKWMATSSANEAGDKGRAGMLKTLEVRRDRVGPEDFVAQTGRQGPKGRGVRRQEGTKAFEPCNPFHELRSGTACCFTGPECGSLNAIAHHEVSRKGYGHVCLLICPGASDSVMPKH